MGLIYILVKGRFKISNHPSTLNYTLMAQDYTTGKLCGRSLNPSLR